MSSQRENALTPVPPAGLPVDPHQEAIDTAERLRSALERHGVKFPSLRGSYPVYGSPFIELGGCHANVARRLAEVLDSITPEGGQ